MGISKNCGVCGYLFFEINRADLGMERGPSFGKLPTSAGSSVRQVLRIMAREVPQSVSGEDGCVGKSKKQNPKP